MSLTRRDFLRSLPLAGAMAAVFGTRAIAELPATRGFAAVTGATALTGSASAALHSVLSFHLDQPWLDATGQAAAYHPPAGARGAEPLALLDEHALSRFYGAI